MTSPYSSNLLQHPVTDGPRPSRPGMRMDPVPPADRVRHDGAGGVPVGPPRTRTIAPGDGYGQVHQAPGHRVHVAHQAPAHPVAYAPSYSAPAPVAYAPSHSAPAPAPVSYAPQSYGAPHQQHQQGGGAGAVSNLLMAIVVFVLALVAAIGGWAMARSSAPDGVEANRMARLASATGFSRGRAAGLPRGRAQARATTARTTAAGSAVAGEAAYARGYGEGRQFGMSSYRKPTVPSLATSGWGRGYGYGSGSRYGRGYDSGYGRGYGGYSGYGNSGWGNGGAGTSFGWGGSVGGALATAQGLANATGAPVDVEIY